MPGMDDFALADAPEQGLELGSLNPTIDRLMSGQGQSGPPQAAQGGDRRQMLALAALLPILAQRGGRAGVAAFLNGVQQAKERKAQETHRGRLESQAQQDKQAALDIQRQRVEQQGTQQQAVLDQRAEARRGLENQAGVRRMAIDSIRGGGDPRQAMLMAAGEGVSLPTGVVPATPNTDKRGFTAKDVTVNGKRMTANYDPDTGNYYALGDTTTPLKGEILEYQKPDRPTNEPRQRYNVQTFTKPDGTTGFIRVNLDTGEATPVVLPDGTGAGKPNESQGISRAYLDRTTASNTTAKSFESQLATLGSQLDVKLPNLLRSQQGQQYRQAKDEFINAALRRESGAAIQPSEYARYDAIYFVQPGDTAVTIKQKQAARSRVIDGFRVASGNLGVPAPTVPAPAAAAPGLGLSYQDYLAQKAPK